MKPLKHSRQRESIKSCLAGRCDHPTADDVYTSIREEFPHISLGTVYRNLNLLVDLGEIQKLSCGDGKDHFDANTAPHYHFLCRECGAVTDLPLPPLADVERRAEEAIGARVDSHTIIMYGSCHSCLGKNFRS